MEVTLKLECIALQCQPLRRKVPVKALLQGKG